MVVQLLIFDFDGVVVDSEELASRALVGLARDLGVQISQGEALDRFVGKRAADVALAIEQLAGHALPNFISDLERRTFAIFDSELREVRGLRQFLIKTSSIRRCIASSSSQERIRYTLNLLSLEQEFGRIYSADEVERGKPFPDLCSSKRRNLCRSRSRYPR